LRGSAVYLRATGCVVRSRVLQPLRVPRGFANCPSRFWLAEDGGILEDNKYTPTKHIFLSAKQGSSTNAVRVAPRNPSIPWADSGALAWAFPLEPDLNSHQLGETPQVSKIPVVPWSGSLSFFPSTLYICHLSDNVPCVQGTETQFLPVHLPVSPPLMASYQPLTRHTHDFTLRRPLSRNILTLGEDDPDIVNMSPKAQEQDRACNPR
jgi:hypothetical protein